MTTIVRFPHLVNGAPWGHGAMRVMGSPPRSSCRLCGWPGRRKVGKSSLIGIHRMCNGVDLCTTCAARTLRLAMGRPFDGFELAAMRTGHACAAVPMDDHLAPLYQVAD